MTTTNLHLLMPWQAAAPDAELAAKQHEAALIAQVRNATIAECQRFIRDHAEIFGQVSAEAGRHYRDCACLIEVLRS